MENLRIGKFQARYHLPPSWFGQKERLDRVRDEILDFPLSMALERLGISPREEICIRRVCAPVRLKYSSADVDLVMQWSISLAERFFQIITTGDPENVVRYPSRLGGLFDFADSVARGDFQRAWAWRQIGFSVSRRVDSSVEAAKGLVETLIREPECIVPVLSRLAERGRIAGLLKRIPAVWWRDLAMAALAVHGVVDAEAAMATRKLGREKTDVVKKRRALRIAKASSLAGMIDQERSWFSDHAGILPVWAIFVILEQEPDVFSGAEQEAASLRFAVEDEIRIAAGLAGPAVFGDSGMEIAADADDSPGGPQASNTGEISVEENGQMPGRHSKSATSKQGSEPENLPETAVMRDDDSVSRTFDRGRSEPGNFQVENRGEKGPVQAIPPHKPSLDVERKGLSRKEEFVEEAPVEKEDLPMSRRWGCSEYGGLLFMLVLLIRSGIAEKIVGTDIVAKRSMRWFLHATALCLLPVEQNDPAALAFCGLRPGDSLPWKDDPGPTEEELRMLTHWRTEIVEKLAVSIYKGKREKSAERVLQEVCRRRAEIIADPGWIEAIFSIRDVSTDIRRAGLDLDPGFIPWLGAVVKFYYE